MHARAWSGQGTQQPIWAMRYCTANRRLPQGQDARLSKDAFSVSVPVCAVCVCVGVMTLLSGVGSDGLPLRDPVTHMVMKVRVVVELKSKT